MRAPTVSSFFCLVGVGGCRHPGKTTKIGNILAGPWGLSENSPSRQCKGIQTERTAFAKADIYVCVYIYRCIYMYVSIYVRMYIHIHTYIHTHIYTLHTHIQYTLPISPLFPKYAILYIYISYGQSVLNGLENGSYGWEGKPGLGSK